MDQNLEKLFSGKFYIDESYGIGLVPSIISIFTGKSIIEKSESDKIKDIEKIHLNVNSSISEADSILNNNSAKVVVLDFKQPVIKYSTYYWLGTQSYISILERLKNDPTVAGVVIDTDSGGGQSYGTPEMYDAVKSFAEVKPLGFYTNGYLCSGAYYIAAPSTFIMANKRADAIGSIGAYTIMINYNGLLEKYGAKVNTIYSDLSPDKNKGYRGVMDGTDEDYKYYISKELNPIVLEFHADMIAARPQLAEEVLKGGTWNGADSISKGLVDYNGTLQDAISKVFELSNTSNSNNNNPKTNSKKKTMSKTTKSFPLIQGILGIEEEGIKNLTSITGKTGVQITEAQLEALEGALVAKEEAVTTANGLVTTAEGKVTQIETLVDTAITSAKLTNDVAADADTEAKINLLASKVVEYGKKPGAIVTKPKAEGDAFETEDAIVEASDAHNEIYNKV